MNIEPRLNYFSIWRATFQLMFQRAGLTLRILLLAAPFLAINGLINANHMMAFGGAAMTGSEIPLDDVRLLWLSLVAGDSLAFTALAIAGLLAFKYSTNENPLSFTRYIFRELPRLLGSASFWLFAALQILFFAMVNTPDGRFKLSGMALLAGAILLFWRSRDRDIRRLDWKAWRCLLLVVLTFPVLYILINGYLNQILLMLVDLAGQQIMPWFAPTSPVLPFGIITLSKFLSQCFNLLPLLFLLSAHLARREAPAAGRGSMSESGLSTAS